ncbi:SseB family protein [Agrococcus casei]|uniref:SseB family protein n=1 Tax=Agrococcus casei TaxID=343512 RepID=UPI003F9030E7
MTDEQQDQPEIDYAPLTDVVNALGRGEEPPAEFNATLLDSTLVMPLRMNEEDPSASPEPLTIEAQGNKLVLCFTEPSPKLAAKVAEATQTFAPVKAALIIKGLGEGFGLLVEAEEGAVGIREEDLAELKASLQ